MFGKMLHKYGLSCVAKSYQVGACAMCNYGSQVVVVQCNFGLVTLFKYWVSSSKGKNSRYVIHWLKLAMSASNWHSLVEGIIWKLLRLLFACKLVI